MLQLHGEFRRRLEPILVTPSQAGVLLFLRRRSDAKLTDAAAALRVRQPTLHEVVKDLVRKRRVIKHRSVTDTRAVWVSLSRQGQALAQMVKDRVRNVKRDLISRKEASS